MTQRRTDNTTNNTVIYKTLHRKLKIEQHEVVALLQFSTLVLHCVLGGTVTQCIFRITIFA
jgi:hypothetical protein